MKYVNWIFVVLFISSLTSFVEKDKLTSGLNVGDIAPDFTLNAIPGTQQQFSLKEIKAKYVLLSFWASYDAQSRMQNVSLNNVIRQGLETDVQLVSVSFDDYKSIFDETLKKDRISIPSCFVETNGETSPVYKTYRLNKGFTNYLLDAKGVIIAKNILASELTSYLNSLVSTKNSQSFFEIFEI